MIGLDTNVLVRYLTQDDPQQSARATRLFEQELTRDEPGFVGLIVLAETVWVLRRLYRATSDELLQTVSDLLGTAQLVIENRPAVNRALRQAKSNGCEFTDALIAASARNAGCTRTVTFDRGARIADMTLLG